MHILAKEIKGKAKLYENEDYSAPRFTHSLNINNFKYDKIKI